MDPLIHGAGNAFALNQSMKIGKRGQMIYKDDFLIGRGLQEVRDLYGLGAFLDGFTRFQQMPDTGFDTGINAGEVDSLEHGQGRGMGRSGRLQKLSKHHSIQRRHIHFRDSEANRLEFLIK